MDEESTFMPDLTLGYGLFLVVWGIVVSILSASDSITSYFPSFLGAPLVISGWLAKSNPEKRKLWMHIAVVFGLVCALGGTRFFRGLRCLRGHLAPYRINGGCLACSGQTPSAESWQSSMPTES